MKSKQVTAFLCLALVLTFFGCAGIRPQTDPGLDKQAVAIATAVRSLNQDIESSKGFGWIKLETLAKKDKFQIAWVAARPNRLRISFLVSGHLVETIVATGKKVTFISHTGEHKPYTMASGDPDLEKFIHVPIRLSEMISILLGQVLIPKFNDAWFSPQDSESIILKQKFQSSMILLDLKQRLADRIRLQDPRGNTLYSIQYLDYKTIDAHKIPVRLLIQDSKKNRIHLEITQFLPNAFIKESIFRLTEPGS